MEYKDDDDNDNMDESYQVKLANSCGNILVECQLPPSMVLDNQTWIVQTFATIDLSRQQKEEIFQITETNMKDLYEESKWGWKPIDRRNELFHPLSRFLLFFDDMSKQIAAFAIFRFEYDDEDEPEHIVLYCYELQVRSEFQRRSLGSQITQFLQIIGRHFHMWKILLTCFKINIQGMKFYENLGFKIDASSPSAFGYNNESYEILSYSL